HHGRRAAYSGRVALPGLDSDSPQLPRPLPVLERTAPPGTLVVVPLLVTELPNAADVTAEIPQRRVARRTGHCRRGPTRRDPCGPRGGRRPAGGGARRAG